MQGPFEDEGHIIHVCNLTVISLGNSIYESLQHAPQKIIDDVGGYVKKHKSSALSEEALWTVAALQDGISRITPTAENPTNGIGLISALVAFFGFLFQTKNKSFQPTMTIVSGKSCVMIKEPYNKIEGNPRDRVIALNASNSLESPPDTDYVQSLPVKFPGTLITIRFILDNDHLATLMKKNDND